MALIIRLNSDAVALPIQDTTRTFLSKFAKPVVHLLVENTMAMFKEGGKGASVRYISPSDNRGAGAAIMQALKGYDDKMKILFEVIDLISYK